MPNRILFERICTSDTIDQLSAEEERFFYRLMVQVDDYGRFDARPAVLRARCFPLQLDKVRDEDISRWLGRLVEVDLVRLYTFDNQPFLFIVKWEKHQRMRAKTSRFPDPPECADMCAPMTADGGEMPPYSYSRRRRRESETNADADLDMRGGGGENSLTDAESDDDVASPPSAVESAPVPDATKPPPPSESERSLLLLLKGVPNYPFDPWQDLAHIRSLAADFPTIDVGHVLKSWIASKTTKPLKARDSPRSQHRNWCAVEANGNAERSNRNGHSAGFSRSQQRHSVPTHDEYAAQAAELAALRAGRAGPGT